ncbi:family 1 extracellular solute-binding protein [Paenibacillus mucilaginosus 3016]|uniref:Family 1 extracellular solute-binding protein n=1 Tax=Paenibacillus mucilaginosus 3016 TaxID=1116391 RepID=H6NF15_9BACL|nr:extracellular solute-binding protein [Paenibacillus mucilaginosus]AFC29022.1 family 1 extracellular solute-binding protein [Paenibacillus mucilaginosus 3016]
MKKRGGLLAASSLLILSLAVSACSSDNESVDNASKEGNVNTEAAPAAESANPEDLYLGKYAEPVEVSTVRILSPSVKFVNGETIDNNVWYQEYANKLGIKLKNKWSIVGDEPGGQGEQKMNVSIASGDLPDIVPLNSSQLRQLADAGKLADLTKIYEKYASPITKGVLTSSGPEALGSATMDGKLLAIPAPTSKIDQAQMIWIRADWMEKLGLQAPKTMDDVFKIMDAFVNQDPDGNGKKDTYGMAMDKDLYGFFDGLEGFFNSYHAYPRQQGKANWVKSYDGSIVFGSIQPEVRTALGKLQELYKKGYIDPEFGVKDWNKEKELVVGGKIGLWFGSMSAPLVLQDLKSNDPNADLRPFPLVSIDGQPVKAQVPGINLKTPQYLAVTKDAKHPEALIKMINLFHEVSYGTSYTQEEVNRLSTSPEDGIERWMYSIYTAEPEKNLNTHRIVKEVIQGKKNESAITIEQMGAYRSVKKLVNGEKLETIDWALNRVFSPENSSFSLIDNYEKNGQLLPSAFNQVMTETMVKRDSTLLKLELQTFTNIILGESLDSFDKFVENWKKLGGDAMTKEVNTLMNSK